MSLQYLLDTNICIYIQRERPASLLKRFRKLKPGEAAISVVTWGELRFGAAKSRERERVAAALDEFVAAVPVLDMDPSVGAIYGELRAALERAGRPIGNNDLWIAAHARALGLTLVTNNRREFDRVPRLKVENWAA